MRAIFGWLGAALIGSLGWWLGVGLSIGAALVVGCVGAGVGLYYGRKLFEEWLE